MCSSQGTFCVFQIGVKDYSWKQRVSLCGSILQRAAGFPCSEDHTPPHRLSLWSASFLRSEEGDMGDLPQRMCSIWGSAKWKRPTGITQEAEAALHSPGGSCLKGSSVYGSLEYRQHRTGAICGWKARVSEAGPEDSVLCVWGADGVSLLHDLGRCGNLRGTSC